MSFRLAIGQCDCSKPYRDEVQEWACGWIEIQLAEWRSRLPGDLAAFPKEAFDDRVVDGHRVTLGMIRQSLDNGDALLVLQVFVHTWRKPTFWSIGRVGRIYAEGLLISAKGTVSQPPNEMMWEFR